MCVHVHVCHTSVGCATLIRLPVPTLWSTLMDVVQQQSIHASFPPHCTLCVVWEQSKHTRGRLGVILNATELIRTGLEHHTHGSTISKAPETEGGDSTALQLSLSVTEPEGVPWFCCCCCCCSNSNPDSYSPVSLALHTACD